MIHVFPSQLYLYKQLPYKPKEIVYLLINENLKNVNKEEEIKFDIFQGSWASITVISQWFEKNKCDPTIGTPVWITS